MPAADDASEQQEAQRWKRALGKDRENDSGWSGRKNEPRRKTTSVK